MKKNTKSILRSYKKYAKIHSIEYRRIVKNGGSYGINLSHILKDFDKVKVIVLEKSDDRILLVIERDGK